MSDKIDKPIGFKLEIKVKDREQIYKLVKQLAKTENSDFSWAYDGDVYILTISSSWRDNLVMYSKLIPREKGWNNE